MLTNKAIGSLGCSISDKGWLGFRHINEVCRLNFRPQSKKMCIFAIKIMSEDYGTQGENATSMASEPQVAYGDTQQVLSMQGRFTQSMRLGYMSLECFGELFHQKLDACYAELQGDTFVPN